MSGAMGGMTCGESGQVLAWEEMSIFVSFNKDNVLSWLFHCCSFNFFCDFYISMS